MATPFSRPFRCLSKTAGFFRLAARLRTDPQGFAASPAAAALFVGLVLILVVYSVMEHTGMMGQMGNAGRVLPLLVIAGAGIGVYKWLVWLKTRSRRMHLQGPLYLRTLMDTCLSRTCAALQKRLDTPAATTVTVLNDLLLDKVLHIGATDCLRFSDIRRRIEVAGLRGTRDLALADFLRTHGEYEKAGLPEEIRQVADMAARGQKEFEPLLNTLTAAHKALCTGCGDFLSLLPPDARKVDQLRAQYRYRPPDPDQARRMVFALDTLLYLRATRHENVNPMDHRKYDAVAAAVIPCLAAHLSAYRDAWQAVVDLYEAPRKDR